MNNGYIKLWRKSIENGWLRDHKLWVFWSYCLMKATHKKRSTIMGGQQIQLQKGEFVFGRRVASIETGLSERAVRTNLTKLKKMQNVTSRSTNKFTIISVVNWDIYQARDIETDQQSDQQPTSNRPTTDQQVTTDKKDKNVKNEENVRKKDGGEQIKIPLKNGEDFTIEADHIEELKDTYPDVEIMKELKEILQWNRDNPTKRKTPSGIRRHINTWMAGEQEKRENQAAFGKAMKGGFMKDLKKEINHKSEKERVALLKQQVREGKDENSKRGKS